jgi:hypothetical protein
MDAIKLPWLIARYRWIVIATILFAIAKVVGMSRDAFGWLMLGTLAVGTAEILTRRWRRTRGWRV